MYLLADLIKLARRLDIEDEFLERIFEPVKFNVYSHNVPLENYLSIIFFDIFTENPALLEKLQKDFEELLGPTFFKLNMFRDRSHLISNLSRHRIALPFYLDITIDEEELSRMTSEEKKKKLFATYAFQTGLKRTIRRFEGRSFHRSLEFSIGHLTIYVPSTYFDSQMKGLRV